MPRIAPSDDVRAKSIDTRVIKAVVTRVEDAANTVRTDEGRSRLVATLRQLADSIEA